MRGGLVLVWLACVPMVLFWDHGRRVFWTCLVALVPLLWVVGGYHFWRAVCPLGFFATLAQRFGREGPRKLGGRWLGWGLLFNLAVMALALCARLLALNGERVALAGFILGVSLLAAVLGFVFKGKTWCNFLCPVGLVEKLYTEPLPRPGSPTSRCAACSGCRKACPDIDLEQRGRLRERLLAALQALDRPAEELEALLPSTASPRPEGLLARVLARLDGARDPELDDLVALRELQLLQGLASVDLVRVLDLAQERRFEQGERICERGQVEDRVYVLRSGEVEVELGAGARRLGPGACIGELAVLDPAPRSATVRALGPVEALVLEGEDFRHLGTTRPSLSEGLLRSLARRLRETAS